MEVLRTTTENPVFSGLEEGLERIKTQLPPELVFLAELMAERDFCLYAVGGLVRNSLLGLPVYDIDICSAMTPDKVIDLLRRRGYTVVPKGVDFGMVEVHIGACRFEHTTFRSDSYGAGGAHRPSAVRFSETPEEDAFRRDFTVNALYYDILGGKLIDPTGGLADLENKLIRTTSADPALVLRDDGLRLMRLVRFAAELGFEVEPACLETAKKLVGNLADISGERIRDELNKILLCDVKYGERSAEKVYAGLELLDSIGALDVILPELCLGRGMQQKANFHRYDVLRHCLHTAAEAKPTLPARLSGLLHDVGKPPVKQRTGRMHGHDIEGAEIAREILHRLHYDNKTIDSVVFTVRHHMYDLNNTAKDCTLRRTFVRWGYERSLDIADIRTADVHGSGVISGRVASAERWRRTLETMKAESVPFSEKELNCTGLDIIRWLDIPPGPQIADIKRRLVAHCSVHPGDNTPEKLKKIAFDIFVNGAE